MKRQIRRGVFETNSSSTHSIVIGTKSEYDKWAAGELFYKDGFSQDKIPNGFITKEQAIEHVKSKSYYHGELDNIAEMGEKEVYEIFREDDVYGYETWGDGYEFEETYYVTPSGEEIVACCYYGQDF